MSQFTFNIADYRPLAAVRQHRAHNTIPALNRPAGFVVLRSDPREHLFEWLEPRPSVVDIRSVRDDCRITPLACTRRARVLPFLSQAPDRVCTMPASNSQSGDDPDPTAA
jgi:hypothetical protein